MPDSEPLILNTPKDTLENGLVGWIQVFSPGQKGLQLALQGRRHGGCNMHAGMLPMTLHQNGNRWLDIPKDTLNLQIPAQG